MEVEDSTHPEDLDDLEPVEIEFTDVLDLHAFRPSEVKELVPEYLDAVAEQGLRQLRIIHGKGSGVQRRIVRSILERDPRVVAYGDAGSWGATWITLVGP